MAPQRVPRRPLTDSRRPSTRTQRLRPSSRYEAPFQNLTHYSLDIDVNVVGELTPEGSPIRRVCVTVREAP